MKRLNMGRTWTCNKCGSFSFTAKNNTKTIIMSWTKIQISIQTSGRHTKARLSFLHTTTADRTPFGNCSNQEFGISNMMLGFQS